MKYNAIILIFDLNTTLAIEINNRLHSEALKCYKKNCHSVAIQEMIIITSNYHHTL